MRFTMKGFVLAAAAIGAAIFAMTALAGSGTGGNTANLTYTASSGQDNTILIFVSGGDLQVQDSGGVTAGGGCDLNGAFLNTLDCGPVSGGNSLNTVTVKAGDGNDIVTVDPTVTGLTSITLDGGAGSDSLRNTHEHPDDLHRRRRQRHPAGPGPKRHRQLRVRDPTGSTSTCRTNSATGDGTDTIAAFSIENVIGLGLRRHHPGRRERQHAGRRRPRQRHGQLLRRRSPSTSTSRPATRAAARDGTGRTSSPTSRT